MTESYADLLTKLLAITLLVSVVGLGLIAVFPVETDEPFTEFYVLGPDGTASGYPQNLSVGESGTFIVGITNHERGAVTYTFVMSEGGETLAQREVAVSRGETWEREFSYSPDAPGEKRVQLRLYKSPDPTGEPYRQLRLVISVD